VGRASFDGLQAAEEVLLVSGIRFGCRPTLSALLRALRLSEGKPGSGEKKTRDRDSGWRLCAIGAAR